MTRSANPFHSPSFLCFPGLGLILKTYSSFVADADHFYPAFFCPYDNPSIMDSDLTSEVQSTPKEMKAVKSPGIVPFILSRY